MSHTKTEEVVESKPSDNVHKKILAEDADGHKFLNQMKKFNQLRRKELLEELGCVVKDLGDAGFLINDKFIMSRNTMRWRTVGKYKWYWMSSENDFVTKYVKREGGSCGVG